MEIDRKEICSNMSVDYGNNCAKKKNEREMDLSKQGVMSFPFKANETSQNMTKMCINRKDTVGFS